MKMFEIYLYEDQAQKSGDGGHVRFVASKDEKSARHKVAFEWGHWWRTCGIREVSMSRWEMVHSSLNSQSAAYVHSQRACKEYHEKQTNRQTGSIDENK